jgi:putative ABC transport system permease protein
MSTRIRLTGTATLNLFFYSLSGSLLGIVSGLVAGYQLAAHLTATAQIQVANLLIPVDVGPFQISRWVIGSSTLVGLLLPLLAGLWPLWEETGITVHQALTSYGVHVETHTPAASWGRRLSWMPQTMWLSLHSLFRKPKRLAITLLSLGLSSAAFFSVQLTNASFWAKIEQVRNIYHSDLRIDLSSSVGDSVPSQQVILALRALPNVLRVESIDPIPISIEGRVLELDGLLAETQLYQPQITSGR